MKSSTMIGGSGAFDRNSSDFYSTPDEVTQALLKKHAPRSYLVQEPACGNGAITTILQKNGFCVISSDINQNPFNEIQDFLKLKQARAPSMITNPPFNHAVDFILKSKELGYIYTALLLKSSFWQAANRTRLFNFCRPSAIYALNWRPCFSPERGTAPTMDFIWSIWDILFDPNKTI